MYNHYNLHDFIWDCFQKIQNFSGRFDASVVDPGISEREEEGTQ
jgi:hypothetical protein